MKKKIIGIFTVLCLVFPCFFMLACKAKQEPNFEPYTYSVTLKNAYGKIDADALVSEYDHEKNENVNWTKENNDYVVSVTKTSQHSGAIVISLLEGFDYSNLTLLTNGESASFSIKSGANANCATTAHLTDRQLVYEFSKVKDDTSIEIDFTNCELAKISLDISKLKEHNARYCVVEDDFVTMLEGQSILSNKFKNVNESVIVVDYGTIIAFDYSEKIILSNSLNQIQNLSYASYGLRYLMSTNRIQYITASVDGKFEVYSPIIDPDKNGTLRVLGQASGLNYASSLSALQNKFYEITAQEFQYYDGEMLAMTIVAGQSIFIELDSDAQNFNYYLVDELDEKWVGALQQNTIADTDRKYIEVNLTNSDGTATNAKYLVRKAKAQNNFYAVYADNMQESTRFTNADYIVIGEKNKSTNVSSIDDKVFYYFAKDKAARVALPAINFDKKTNVGQKNLSVEITAKNINQYGKSERDAALVNVDPATVSTVTVDCYLATDDNYCYSVNFHFSPASFDEIYFSVSSSDLNLYEGESFYYTTNPTDLTSWKKLEHDTSLELYSGDGTSLYYYTNSSRPDAGLHLENLNDERISTVGNLLDCFGRPLRGIVDVDGEQINLTEVKYLQITPGYYNYTIAKLVRDYDELYHKVDLSQVTNETIKVSYDNHTLQSDFVNLEGNILEIRYTGTEVLGEIYYYIDSSVNKELTIIDKDGNVISTSYLVYENDQPVKVDNKYVYCLSLNTGYYAEGEAFSAIITDAYYTLVDELGEAISVYISDVANKDEMVSQINEKVSYFVTCEDAYRLDICDELGNVVIAWESFTSIPVLVEGVPLYMFTFEIPNNVNYAPGTSFTLTKSAR